MIADRSMLHYTLVFTTLLSILLYIQVTLLLVKGVCTYGYSKWLTRLVCDYSIYNVYNNTNSVGVYHPYSTINADKHTRSVPKCTFALLYSYKSNT